MKAKIENNTVIDLYDIVARIDDSVWVTCDENVKVGWIYDGQKFSAPTPELVERKINALWDSIVNDDNTQLNALKLELGE